MLLQWGLSTAFPFCQVVRIARTPAFADGHGFPKLDLACLRLFAAIHWHTDTTVSASWGSSLTRCFARRSSEANFLSVRLACFPTALLCHTADDKASLWNLKLT